MKYKMSKAHNKTMNDTIKHLKHDIEEAKKGIERDKATIKKLKRFI